MCVSGEGRVARAWPVREGVSVMQATVLCLSAADIHGKRVFGRVQCAPCLTQVPMNRFRPNIVVDGIEAWEEDRYVVGLRRSRAALAVCQLCLLRLLKLAVPPCPLSCMTCAAGSGSRWVAFRCTACAVVRGAPSPPRIRCVVPCGVRSAGCRLPAAYTLRNPHHSAYHRTLSSNDPS